jgi:hypothetical protein
MTKVHVIIFCEPDSYDSLSTSVIEVHTNIETANLRVKELDNSRGKTYRNIPNGYYDIETVDLIQKPM